VEVFGDDMTMGGVFIFLLGSEACLACLVFVRRFGTRKIKQQPEKILLDFGYIFFLYILIVV
jgi:hypothetical protein